MKNFYNISFAQVSTVMVFGGIIAFWALSESEYNSTFLGLFWLIIGLLVFYGIGWREANKK